MNIPCFCSNCNTLFAKNNLVAGNGTVTFNNCATNCPLCGQTARILDGTYTMYDDIFRTIMEGGFDRLKAQQILNIASQSINNVISSSQTFKEVEAVSPKMAKLMQTYSESNKSGRVLLIFLSIFIFILAPLGFIISKPTLDRAGKILADNILPIEDVND